ncbi:hypothetical protein A9G09_11775 [Gilliamella sp. wkB292]|uniref:hypothetical protein n=1 Tax=Gilliamella sp. wkB292 TaxID=3120262 RepID=UPI00080EC020|nr:hypothetical protein [Gilliamella apicola]OCG10785.1 hypothetical protein A9G09_11775 [Gilliamella apicola]
MKFLKKLFGLNKEKSTADNTKLRVPTTQSTNLEEMLTLEISRCNLIKEDCKPNLIKEFNLLSSPDFGDEFLTTEEKKSLNLNSRMKIHKKIISVLTDDALDNESNPKNIILNLVYSARNKVSLNEELKKIKELKIKNLKVLNVGDARDCDWCISMDKKIIPADTDYVALINQNCTCDYYRGRILADIKIE